MQEITWIERLLLHENTFVALGVVTGLVILTLLICYLSIQRFAVFLLLSAYYWFRVTNYVSQNNVPNEFWYWTGGIYGLYFLTAALGWLRRYLSDKGLL